MSVEQFLASLKNDWEASNFELILEKGEDFLDEHDELGAALAPLYLYLANAAIQLERWSDADYYALKAKRLQPNEVAPLFVLASIQVRLQHYIQAQEYYQQILEQQPKHLETLVHLGDLFYLQALYPSALDYYQQALEQGAKEKLSATAYAIMLARGGQAQLLDDGAEAALGYLQKHEPTAFQEAIWLFKRQLYAELQDIASLLDCLETLHKGVPSKASYLLEWADLLDENKEAAKVEELYSKALALELEPTQEKQALLGRATLRMEQGNAKEALKDWNQLLELEESWFAYQKRSETKETLQDIKGALTDISAAMKLQAADSPQLYAQRAGLWSKAKAYDKAIVDYKKALQAQPEQAIWYYQLGLAYHKSGATADAVKMLLKSDLLGYNKAKELLIKHFKEQLTKLHAKNKANYQANFKAAIPENTASPILQNIFSKLWVADMPKFIQSIEEDLKLLPGKVAEGMLEAASNDLVLLTPEALLLYEGGKDPIEAVYRIVVSSDHAVVIELQPLKGGNPLQMRLSTFEDNLLISYPLGGVEVAPKYFKVSTHLNSQQETILKQPPLGIPYIASLTACITPLLDE